MPKLKPGTVWPAPATVDLTEAQLKALAATDLTFDQVEATYGEDIAIRVGIARDPDTRELTAEDFARMRPATEVAPLLVAAYRRGRGKQKAPTKQHIGIRLDADIVAHFRAGGRGWQTRLNDTLRQAVFGPSAAGERK